jgi:DMSO/TMAO reductase YedYZ molybdopterin-dependent catalytic subunit
MRKVRFVWLLVIAASLGAQTVAVTGAVKQPLTLAAKDFAAMPRTTAAVTDHGKTVTYEGVLLYNVLLKAGAPLGAELSGKALASYILASAKDGYQVVYTLTEIDPAFCDSRIVLADAADGNPLPSTQGPFRIVVPNEKKGARSIRMLERIEVIRLRP